MRHTVTFSEGLQLESGDRIPQLTIDFVTYGKLNPQRDNVVWVCHPATEDCDLLLWWKDMVAPGNALDPEKYFIVCSNVIGSPFGCTNCSSTNPATGTSYGDSFPSFTVRDMVTCLKMVAGSLGIASIRYLVGCSLGGFEAMEWSVQEPGRFGSATFIATAPRTSPWLAALQQTQRMAIMAAGESDAGLGVARDIAILSFRGPKAFDITQEDVDDPLDVSFKRRVQTYMTYQAAKIERLFTPSIYLMLTHAIDSHNLYRGRGEEEEVLKRISMPVTVVSIDTDPLFPSCSYKKWVGLLPNAELHELHSIYGHDTFLIDRPAVNRILRSSFG